MTYESHQESKIADFLGLQVNPKSGSITGLPSTTIKDQNKISRKIEKKNIIETNSKP